MKNYILTSSFLFFVFLFSFQVQGQNRKKAERAVQEYLEVKYPNYKTNSFGDFFKQPHPEEMQREIKTTKKIKYSIVHSYKIGENMIKDEYFHLDKNYVVLGQVSNERMIELTSDMAFNKLKNSQKTNRALTNTPSSQNHPGQNLKIELFNKTGYDIDSISIGNKYIGFIRTGDSLSISDCKEIAMQDGLPFGLPYGIIKNKKRNTEGIGLCSTGVESVSNGIYKFDITVVENELGYRLFWSFHK